MTLPDCMMPDGAEPCIGYSELEAKLAELRAENERLKCDMKAMQEQLCN